MGERRGAAIAWLQPEDRRLFCRTPQHAASLTHNPNNNWGNPRGNNTAFLLDAMLDYHMPLLLIHGHWHNPLVYKQWGCTFVSLGELETFDLDVATTRT